MFDNIVKLFKNFGKKDKDKESSDTAKERLHLVLMQDRANVSADFLELMKQEIIEVIKKYIDVDEKAIDVRLTNKTNEDGTVGAPALYANIPITTIKNENVNTNKQEEKAKEEKKEEPKATEKQTEENEEEKTIKTTSAKSQSKTAEKKTAKKEVEETETKKDKKTTRNRQKEKKDYNKNYKMDNPCSINNWRNYILFIVTIF